MGKFQRKYLFEEKEIRKILKLFDAGLSATSIAAKYCIEKTAMAGLINKWKKERRLYGMHTGNDKNL